MRLETNNLPFNLLPETLVEEMLTTSETLGNIILDIVKEVNSKKKDFRRELVKEGLLRKDSDLIYSPIPTTCGIDGSFVIEKLLAVDLVACAAVAIEGLTPPSENRFWEKPYHKVFIHPEKHHPDTSMMIRGIMWEMEIELASKAPHDVVFVDGSLTNPLMNLNPAVNKLKEFSNSSLGKTLQDNFSTFLKSYKNILDSNRTDKLWVGLPKYTSKREIGELKNWPSYFDDKAILTSILESGEYIIPVPYKQDDEWHLQLIENDNESLVLLEQIIRALNRLHVLYYKPHSFTPAIRIEIPPSLSSNQHQLALLLHAIRYQCNTPGIMEPYPLYLADRMVKNLSSAIPACRQTATKKMAESFEDDLSEIFFNMHSYRSEQGR